MADKKNSVVIHIRLDSEVYSKLSKQAEADRRPLIQYARILILDGLKRHQR